MKWFSISIIAILALGFNQVTQAASFDCNLAKSPTEKAICNDSALSLLDEKLNVAFKAAREQWASAARDYVLNDQRAWLRDVEREIGRALTVQADHPWHSEAARNSTMCLASRAAHSGSSGPDRWAAARSARLRAQAACP